MLLCLALSFCTLSCAFSITIWLVLQLAHSNLMSIYKSCTFYCSYYFQLWSISFHMWCTSNPLSTNHIPCSLLCTICSLICNASLSCAFVELNVLKFCLASLSNPMSCTFDSHFWLDPLNLLSILAPLFYFFLAPFVHCFLAPRSCTLHFSFLLRPNMQVEIPSSCILSLFVYHMSCTINSFVYYLPCNFVLHLWSFLSFSVNSDVNPYIFHRCLLPLSHPSITFFAPPLACMFETYVQCVSPLSCNSFEPCHLSCTLSCTFSCTFECWAPIHMLYSSRSLCRMVMPICLRYTQYGLYVLSTGLAAAPMLLPNCFCHMCLRSTQCCHCIESWCQIAYAILSMIFVYYLLT